MNAGRSQKSGVRSQNLRVGIILAAAALTLAACTNIQRDPPLQVWPDMKFQPKFRAQLQTDLFADHRQSRTSPQGTIAQGHMQEDTPFYTGMEGKCSGDRGAVNRRAVALHHLLHALS
jgi:hypothetical protein